MHLLGNYCQLNAGIPWFALHDDYIFFHLHGKSCQLDADIPWFVHYDDSTSFHLFGNSCQINAAYWNPHLVDKSFHLNAHFPL